MGFFESILDFIFPSRPNCLLCGASLGGNGRICGGCWEKISGCGLSICSLCGRYWPLETEVVPAICHECTARHPLFSLARSVGIYGGVLRDAIYLYKYQGYRTLAEEFGVMLSELFMREAVLPGATALVPVPLSTEKLKLRGFNQSELLARKMSTVLGIPLKNYLTKVKNTPSQSKLTREARIDSVKEAFRLNESPEGAQVLLIDDILTTGATVEECSRVLLQGGAYKVAVLTLAGGSLEKRFRGSVAREEKVGICRN